MTPTRSLTGSVVTLVVVFTVLIWPWPGVQRAYTAAYCWVGTALFRDVGQGLTVEVRPLAALEGRMDSEVVIRSLNPPGGTRAPHNARSGYVAMVELVALVLATPIAWSRRWKALVLGVFLVNLYVTFRLAVVVFEGLLACPVWTVIEVGPTGARIMQAAVDVIAKSPTLSFVVPALIWMLVTFRRSDLVSIAEHLRPDEVPPDDQGAG